MSVFLDPVEELAVLDSPDAQDLIMVDKAHAHDRLIEATPLGREIANARLLLIDGPSFDCVVRAIKGGAIIHRETRTEN